MDQRKPISLIFKIKKIQFKNPNFVNCMFIICKNGNTTSIEPILKSNSTSFIFNNIFCEKTTKKLTLWGRRDGRTIQISSWKCNYMFLTKNIIIIN